MTNPKNLVIVESPAKAKTIEKFLGKDFKVMSSFGHIRDLKKKNFGVDLNTFEPQYEIPADKKHVVNDLKIAAHEADIIWLASDEDREGEAISWHLAEVLNIDPKKANRIVFHEITKPAILHAIENPRHVDLNLVDAQQARRVLDRLVGFKLSPVLWRKVLPGLSAGRVQSVAVRLVVEREREIKAFESKMSYAVSALFTLPNGEGEFKATLGKTHFDSEEEAYDFLESCQGKVFQVGEVTTKPSKRSPAPPFTTSTLQQEAARKLGYPVAMTMRVAQTLYERGLITYMRTDSTNLSSLCLKACGDLIEKIKGKSYHKVRQYHTKAKGAQEAHEAIRPTNMEQETISGSAQEQKLYSLIWKRTIACQMADAQLQRTTMQIEADGVAHPFIATGEVLTFDGFISVYRESRDDEEKDSDKAILPQMLQGQDLQTLEIKAAQHFTTPPSRYNEASLVHKLEELGIGRPSTYAPTISTIQQREYVVRNDAEAQQRTIKVLMLKNDQISTQEEQESFGAEKKKLSPTDVGMVVNDYLIEGFPQIMDYNFTARVEKEFDKVAEGEENWKSLIEEFYQRFDPQVEKALNENTGRKVGEREIGIDPESGKPLSAKIGPYGPMVQLGETGDDEKPQFASLLPGQSIATITLEEALKLFSLPRNLGKFEGEDVIVNRGRFGPYVLHKKVFTSIPKGEDPLKVPLERAVELILAKREADEQKFIKNFEEAGIEVLNGRYGPYVKFEKKNYKIPKQLHEKAAELTLEDCQKIIEEGKKPTKKRKTTTKKSTKS